MLEGRRANNKIHVLCLVARLMEELQKYLKYQTRW